VANELGFRDIWVRVLPSNAAALACYEGAGFLRTTADEEACFNRGQPYDYVWLSGPQSPAT
jgi:RimJ/RimL family protein N-acetyltransferase